MKRYLLVAKEKSNTRLLRKKLKSSGFQEVKKNPEFIVSLGGDGTFLIAERKYPGVPKLLVRESKGCYLCSTQPLDTLLTKIKDNTVHIAQYKKLDARIITKNKKIKILLATNDVIIRNKRINQALRFSVAVNNKKIERELVGEGIVLATPLGSRGYYWSITHAPFKNGIGLAYNNIHNKRMKYRVLKPADRITLRILRGLGEIAVDNSNGIILLNEGNTVRIQQSRRDTVILR